MNATELRKNVFRILDQVLQTGQPVAIDRKGGKLLIIREDASDRLTKLAGKKKKAYLGDSDEIIGMDWSSEWKPKHI